MSTSSFLRNISPFLDVFDIERYFGHVVPVKALRSPLLTNALTAIAAKQFAKTRRETDSDSDQTLSGSVLGNDLGSSIDLFYKAAFSYDTVICQMLGLIQDLNDDGSVTIHSTGSTR